MTHDDLMATAVAETGLDDFGDDSFREGLEILAHALDEEARLNAAGEAFLYPRIVGHLAQRLQVEDWYRRHPEIDEVPIDAPLFGVSLPRTGSTALSFLLAQDPEVRYLRMWESGQPCPPPSTVDGPDPRIGHTGLDEAGTKAHVPADEHGPMECLELMSLDFKSQIFQAFAQIPSYSEWFVDADLTSAYLYERSRVEAPAVGGTTATVAAQVARARAVARCTRPRVSGRAVRDDASGPHRRDAVGVRRLRRHRGCLHRRHGP